MLRTREEFLDPCRTRGCSGVDFIKANRSTRTTMKYVLMFTSRPDLDESIPPEHAKAVYAQVYAWFQEHGAAGRIADGGAELHPVTTATTVKSGDDEKPLVVDGPFNEAKEIVGGFTVIEVPDLDAAVAMARSWPPLEFPGVAIEIRPMVEDYSQF